MSDRHIRRSGDDYGHALAALLPRGNAWTRDPQSVLMRVVNGLAKIFGFVDSRAADLLERESDPRQTIELLKDWERAFGLPDPCVGEPQTIEARQRVLVMKMTMLGRQDRQFFIDVAAMIGYEVKIREWSPFMCGISRCGDTRGEWGEMFYGDRTVPTSGDPEGGELDGTVVSGGVSGDFDYNFRWEIGPPEMRFYWAESIGVPSINWFRASSGQCGIDPHMRLGIGTDHDCLANRWKPAHTTIVFDYSRLRYGGAMQGTP